MSFKKAFRAVFNSYRKNGCISCKYLKKIAKWNGVDFKRLKGALENKGLNLVA